MTYGGSDPKGSSSGEEAKAKINRPLHPAKALLPRLVSPEPTACTGSPVLLLLISGVVRDTRVK